MRIPVHQLRGKSKKREATPEDALADELSKTYTVMREKTLPYADAQGQKQTLVFDIAIPAHKLVVEIQQTKQDTKSIIAEMHREKVANANGWRVCRLTARDATNEDGLYRVRREIERPSR